MGIVLSPPEGDRGSRASAPPSQIVCEKKMEHKKTLTQSKYFLYIAPSMFQYREPKPFADL
jgi:hypothetical protein